MVVPFVHCTHCKAFVLVSFLLCLLSYIDKENFKIKVPLQSVLIKTSWCFLHFFQLQSPPSFSPLEEESARSGTMPHLQCIFISISSATPPVWFCDQGDGGGSADNGWVGGFDVANRRNLKPSIIAPIIPPLAPQSAKPAKSFLCSTNRWKRCNFHFRMINICYKVDLLCCNFANSSSLIMPDITSVQTIQEMQGQGLVNSTLLDFFISY